MIWLAYKLTSKEAIGPKGLLFFLPQSGLKNRGFMRGLGPKGPLSGVPQPPKIHSGYGPGSHRPEQISLAYNRQAIWNAPLIIV